MAVTTSICQAETHWSLIIIKKEKKPQVTVKVVKNHLKPLGDVPKSHNPSVMKVTWTKKSLF